MNEPVIYLSSSDDEDAPLRLQNFHNASTQIDKNKKGKQILDPNAGEQGHLGFPAGRKRSWGDFQPLQQHEGIPVCRQFWQVGEYEAFPPSYRLQDVQGSVEHMRVHPNFLRANATSHKWALGAIAELLDNAVDEVQNGATFVRVEKITNPRNGAVALLVQDDGGGMSPDDLRHCMSFGYSRRNTNTSIGQYGNGFKTSTMRLGADVIVLTRKPSDGGFVTQSAGLLSYTFLQQNGYEDIVVPMVDYKLLVTNGVPIPDVRTQPGNWLNNLAIITQWSPYGSENELLKQFEDIGRQGTKVIIYNLWLNFDGILELDFDTNEHDIRLREGITQPNPQAAHLDNQHISKEYLHSLRVYASILYLRMPRNFQIILRGRAVEHHSIAMDLKLTQNFTYRPHSSDCDVMTTIGFVKEAPKLNVQGFNVYHKNRLIMPFWKVLHSNDSQGRGVLGELEANFIKPAHDKQDFERTDLFTRLEKRLKDMTKMYWKAHCQQVGYQPKIRHRGPRSGNHNPSAGQPHATNDVHMNQALEQQNAMLHQQYTNWRRRSMLAEQCNQQLTLRNHELKLKGTTLERELMETKFQVTQLEELIRIRGTTPDTRPNMDQGIQHQVQPHNPQDQSDDVKSRV